MYRNCIRLLLILAGALTITGFAGAQQPIQILREPPAGDFSFRLMPAPGPAQLYVYPDCSDGRVVADSIRVDKGHTAGLEPKVAEELVKLMRSAKGGKFQQAG